MAMLPFDLKRYLIYQKVFLQLLKIIIPLLVIMEGILLGDRLFTDGLIIFRHGPDQPTCHILDLLCLLTQNTFGGFAFGNVITECPYNGYDILF